MLKYLPYLIKFMFVLLALAILSITPLGMTFFLNSINVYVFVIPATVFLLLIFFYMSVIGRQCLEFYSDRKKNN